MKDCSSEELLCLVVRPGEEVSVVPVDEVCGGVVVGLRGTGRHSPRAAVVLVWSRL